jgi:hypothetical protein
VNVIVGCLKSEKRFTLCLDGKVWDVPTHLWSRLNLRRLFPFAPAPFHGNEFEFPVRTHSRC